MTEGKNPFEGKDIKLAPDTGIIEWETEVERWLPEAVGYSVYDALLTDGSDLTDFMDMEPTGELGENGETIAWVTGESWDRGRAALKRYGIDIGPREASLQSDTNLVSLAKRTMAHSERGRG